MKNLKTYGDYLLESNENRINMSVDDVLEHIYYIIYNAPIFMGMEFIDLYPGYKQDNDGEIYYYQSKENKKLKKDGKN